MKHKRYVFLILWIVVVIAIGYGIGLMTKNEIDPWYHQLHRSSLTPPNYLFPLVWGLLYGMIASCGFLLWQAPSFPLLRLIKGLYLIQLLLNWIWTPLFFRYHLIGVSLVDIITLDITVSVLIYLLAYRKMRSVALLMAPYLLWILLATYLTSYIWLYN